MDFFKHKEEIYDIFRIRDLICKKCRNFAYNQYHNIMHIRLNFFDTGSIPNSKPIPLKNIRMNGHFRKAIHR